MEEQCDGKLYFVLCPQLEGRAPAASSPVTTGPASQKNTGVTTAQTAQMVRMKETAVSLFQDGFPFLISGSCGILINLLRLGGSLTDRTSHNMLLVITG